MQFSIKPIYLIHGGEIWQSNNFIDQINNQINKCYANLKKYCFVNFTEFEQFRAKHQAELLNLDLFNQQSVNKLVKINIAHGALSKQQEEIILNLINKNNLIILLIADKLDKKVFNSSWFAAVNKIGAVMAANPIINTYSMQKWVIARFKFFGLNISKEGLIKFSNMYHNNLLEADQNIYKLSVIHKDKKEINTEDLINNSSDEAKCSVFDLTFVLENKNFEQVIYVLNKLKQAREEELLILWSIIKAIKNILTKIDHNNLKIRKKLYLALQQGSLIDLSIKDPDRSDNQYIWGLFINLCLYISLNIISNN
jgi:DNA polymerase III delta subunit